MTPKQVMQTIRQKKVEYIDFRYMDFPGLWQSVTIPASRLTEKTFAEGMGFDGSEVRGWQTLNEADMLLLPVAQTAHLDTFAQSATLAMICDVQDPVTKKQFSRDPRSVARKAASYLKSSKVADRAMFSPEIEFFVFDQVRYQQTVNEATYRVESVEGVWTRGDDSPMNHGMQIPLQEGTFPAPPVDTLREVRARIASVLRDMGIKVDQMHHEVATGGQCEIDLHHADLVSSADACVLLKHVVRSVADQFGKSATFMPKPLYKINGSGMHTHFSLWKGTKPLFPGRHYAGLSKVGLYAIGGLLKHARAIVAFTNPTTNSFKRLVPGYEAPIHLIYSSRNRGAAARVPVYHDNPMTRRVEFRLPDPSCNPYLAFAAMTMAAIDGIKNQIDPGEPIDMPLTELDPNVYDALATAPEDLESALEALEKDNAFLLEGEVFTESLIEGWLRYKREIEVGALRQRPHPHEFEMYYGI